MENKQYNPKRYGDIHALFQPIFEWLQTNYPSGEVRFIVDKTSAQMIINHNFAVFSKEITDMAEKWMKAAGEIGPGNKGEADGCQFKVGEKCYGQKNAPECNGFGVGNCPLKEEPT